MKRRKKWTVTVYDNMQAIVDDELWEFLPRVDDHIYVKGEHRRVDRVLFILHRDAVTIVLEDKLPR